MTISTSDARLLNYSQFFEGLRAIHTDPRVFEIIQQLQDKTQNVLRKSAGQEEAWRAKLQYMASIRMGWADPDFIFSRGTIGSVENLMIELDKFMDTTYVEMESSRDGVFSVYWFQGTDKYQVLILSADKYTLIKTSTMSSDRREYPALSKNLVLKKILDLTT